MEIVEPVGVAVLIGAACSLIMLLAALRQRSKRQRGGDL